MAMMTTSGRGIVSEMNVTPMIDVLLVLVILFMIINTAATPTGLEAVIPKPPDNLVQVQPRTVVVQLMDAATEQPVLRINNEPVGWSELRARLIEVYKMRAERVMFVRADSQIEFREVAKVIDVAHGAFPDMRIGLMR